MSSQELPNTTQAWVLEEFNTPYRLRDLPIPILDDPNDLLIRVEACSYCHTDAVVATGFLPGILPHIGCHEYAGTVVRLPDDLDECHGYRIGDRVAVSGRGHRVCGHCRECKNPTLPLSDGPGYSVFCPRSGAGLGVDKPGGFREYAVVDARQLARMPPELSASEVAPLMCAGLTIYVALVKCGLNPGQRVGIMGCGGGLGHLGLQFATKMGLRTTGVDVKQRALELAHELKTGADIIDASKESAMDVRQRYGKEEGWELPSEMGLDAVIVLPDSQKAFDYSIDLLRDGGKCIVLSFPVEGFHVKATDLVFRKITLEGSLIGSNKAMADMLKFCVENGVRAKITKYSFGNLNDLVKDYHDGIPGKLVLDMEAGV